MYEMSVLVNTAKDHKGLHRTAKGVQTVRTQDTSDPRYFGPRILRTLSTSAPMLNCPQDTSALVPKSPDTSALLYEKNSLASEN